MDENVVETCVGCKTEKPINSFYWKNLECKSCNFERKEKRY